ncbi:lipase [Nocardioides sp. Leaf307]|nr:lipase [Nocardioides sp. Leaf307]
MLDLEDTDRGLVPHRLPRWVRERHADAQLAMAQSQTSGVRLLVRTRATTLALEAVPTKRVYPGLPARPDGVYDLLVDDVPTADATIRGGDTVTLDMAAGTARHDLGPAGTATFTGLPGHDKTVEIWLPHDETTTLVSLGSDAPVGPAERADRPVWLHHGSSLSHGSFAASPTGTWPAVAARAAGVELVNLGLGGSALLDPFLARTLRDTPADLISLEIGINVVNADLMRLRAFVPAVHGFLDTIRDGHPDTPLLVLSPLLCPLHEDTPGPTAPDLDALRAGELRFVATGDPSEVAAGRLTLSVVRRALAGLVAARADDPHLHLLDGLELYDEADHARHPLVDGLHPGPETHREAGERFARVALGGPFGALAH